MRFAKFRSSVILASACTAVIGVDLSRAANVTATWTTGVSGTWSTASRWSGNVAPNNGNGGNTYSVVIGAAPVSSNYTVTLSSTVTIDDLSLNNASVTLNLSSASLAVLSSPIDVAAGTFQMTQGTLTGGSVNVGPGGRFVFGPNSVNYLDRTQVIGDIYAATTGTPKLRLRNGADFTGNAYINGPLSDLVYEYSATLGTGQSIILGGTNSAIQLSRDASTGANTTFTIASGAAVRGAGQLLNGVAGTGAPPAIVNNGLISADVVGQTLFIWPDAFVNNGTLQATKNSYLQLSKSVWTNNGTIQATSTTIRLDGALTNNGTIVLDGSQMFLEGTYSTPTLGLTNVIRSSNSTIYLAGLVMNAGTTLNLPASVGTVELFGGTIRGGTVTLGGGGLLFTSSGGFFDGATLIGDLKFAQSSGLLRLTNGGSFTGNATLSNNNAHLVYEYSGTLASGQTIHLPDLSARLSVSRNSTLGADSTLTIASGATVRGRGSVASGAFTGGTTNTVINNGLISADINGSTLTLKPNVLVNNGMLQAINGGVMSITPGSFTNASTGMLRAASGGRITFGPFNGLLTGNVNGASADGAGSVIELRGTYTLNLPIAVTHGATLNLLGDWTRVADIDNSGFVIFDYASASPAGSIRAALLSGSNSGGWNGPGINSSTASATPGLAVGYAESPVVIGSLVNGFFGNVLVDQTAVLSRLTRYGDSNLDGIVDITDLGALATSWQATGKFWWEGDFNYDGTVDITDLGLLATSWQLPAPLAVVAEQLGLPAVSVPEPAATVLATLPALLLRRSTRSPRRRRI